MEYNGAAIVAMIGKDCVAIAADKRLGVQAQTVSFNFQKIFQMSDKLFVGLPGLATDVQTVYVSVPCAVYTYALASEFMYCSLCSHSCSISGLRGL